MPFVIVFPVFSFVLPAGGVSRGPHVQDHVVLGSDGGLLSASTGIRTLNCITWTAISVPQTQNLVKWSSVSIPSLVLQQLLQQRDVQLILITQLLLH
jgi:hypothetical protein